MKRGFTVLAVLGIALGMLGCADAPKRVVIKPPKEDFHAPPESLSKGPVKYPDDLLNNVTPRRQKDDDKMPPLGGGQGVGLGGGGMGMNSMGR